MSLRQIVVPYVRGYDYGIGADLASGSPMGLSVHGVVSGAPGRGATVDYQIQRITETSELESALGVDVEASFGSAAFGAGVSARFSFAKNSKVQTSSLFMAVTATVDLEFLQIDDPELTEDAARIFSNAEAFKRRYGNMFVRGAVRGGLFVGVLRVDTGSSEESMNISAELEGSYGLFSADAHSKFTEIQRKYRNEVFVRMYHEGGPVNLRINDPTNPVELLNNCNAFLESFQVNAEANARTYAVSLAPVEIARRAELLDTATIQKAQDIVVLCAKRRSLYLDQLNLMEFIHLNPGKFDYSNGADRTKVAAAIADLESDLDLVAECASVAIRDPENASMPAVYAEKNGTHFPKATIPDPLPKANGARMVTVPNFATCKSSSACRQLAAPHSLALEWSGIAEEGAFEVFSTSPPANAPIAEGGKVTVFYRPAKSDISRWSVFEPANKLLADTVLHRVHQ